MAEIRFTHQFVNLDNNKVIKADELVDITIKRADEIVKNVRQKAKEDPNYSRFAEFNYIREHEVELDQGDDVDGADKK